MSEITEVGFMTNTEKVKKKNNIKLAISLVGAKMSLFKYEINRENDNDVFLFQPVTECI